MFHILTTFGPRAVHMLGMPDLHSVSQRVALIYYTLLHYNFTLIETFNNKLTKLEKFTLKNNSNTLVIENTRIILFKFIKI